MEICTIGFTKKSAAQFFGTLKNADVKQLKIFNSGGYTLATVGASCAMPDA